MLSALPRRRHKLATVLAVAAGSLAFGGAGSAQAAPIPCEWYDCDWQVEVQFPPIPPECRCPDIYKKFTDYTTLPELRLSRSDLLSNVAVGSGVAATTGLEISTDLATAGFGR